MRAPQIFIQSQPELRSLLVLSKQHILISNHHIDYLDVLMRTTLGEGWIDLFKLCITSAQMPLFQRAKNAFTKNRKVVELSLSNKFYERGCAYILT